MDGRLTPPLPCGWYLRREFPGGARLLTNTPPAHEFCTHCGRFVVDTAWQTKYQRCLACFRTYTRLRKRVQRQRRQEPR